MALEVVFFAEQHNYKQRASDGNQSNKNWVILRYKSKSLRLSASWTVICGRQALRTPPGPGYSRGAVMIRFSCQFSPRNRVYLGRSVGHSPCKYSAGYFPRPDNFHPHLEYSPRLERRKVESYHQSVLLTISVVQLPMLYTLTVDWLADGDDGRGERPTNLLITSC